MKRSLQRHWYKSILLGALFFLEAVPCVSGQDTLSVNASSQADSLHKQKPQALIIAEKSSRDTLRDIDHARDSERTNSKLERRIPTPERATILSAVLPGLGQAYVGKYWKIPIIYGLGYGLYYYYSEFDKLYVEARNNYEEGKLNGSPNVSTYETARDVYRERRNYCVIGFGILYLANIVDAMTDAYFFQYDISDDLALKVTPLLRPEPVITSSIASMNYGVSLKFSLK